MTSRAVEPVANRITLVAMLVLLVAALVGPKSANANAIADISASGSVVEMEAQGRIEQVRFAADQLVVDGRTYRVTAELNVSIGGTYGAFTMLEPGMRVYLRYLRQADGSRTAIEVRELPAQQRAEQS